MIRKLVRIVTVGAIKPIPKAERIECAIVGGWPVCVKKGAFQVGQRAVYFEIDSFLPQGNPHWEFLMKDHATEYKGVTGRRLKTVEQRGQLSQGLLMSLDVLPPQMRDLPVGTDVSQALGVSKYEKPLTDELMQISEGYRPGHVPGTDLHRVQNLVEEGLFEQYCETTHAWQVTEKLEGESTHYAVLDGKLLACSAQLSFKDLPGNPRWDIARSLGLAPKLAQYKNIVLQGEVVGPGFEGNHYQLQKPEFYLYRVLFLDEGRFMAPQERMKFAQELGIKHVPVLRENFFLDRGVQPEQLLELANGPSALNPAKRREGLVFENRGENISFKAISDRYLLNAKMTEQERNSVVPAAVERLGGTCKDSGTCHHACQTECFRSKACVPLSISGLTREEFAA